MVLPKTFVKPYWLLPLLLWIPLCGGEAQGGSREAMADAMAKMMETMGLLDSGPSGGAPAGMPLDPMSMGSPFGRSSWAPGFAMPGGMPWGSPFQDPSRTFGMGEMMKQFSQNMPTPGAAEGGQPFPWMGSPLEGIWEGRNGELLIVQGNRFRIYSPNLRRVDGYIQVRADRLALYNPDEESARPFEYAESQGRLVMRGAEGETYLYRRLRLDPIEPSTSARSVDER
ncbi:MAG: hypothetical protein U9Q81_10655 [Pseudomonadota bacterium]|nr:hypothetical protein [Pseudomonadota bacterium]